MTNLTFVIHNHQPVGNFDCVVENAAKRAYLPFLETLARFPKIRVGMHYSGVLLDSLERLGPQVIELAKNLASKGQIELVGGAYGEPVLPACTEKNIIEHIQTQHRQTLRLFGVAPRGVWVPERVWEEWLPLPLALAGAEYTFLDDFHFLSAGLERDDLLGKWVTEHEGSKLQVFPISKKLRYLVPFRAPQETIDWLQTLPDGSLVTFGDDGEKFGVWPHTFETCYEEGWLERFFELISCAQGIEVLLPSEAYKRIPAKGPAYLPTCSYPEMMEWSLSPKSQREIRALKPKSGLEASPSEAYLRGASWKNFLHKYKESNLMHKRCKMAEVAIRAKTGTTNNHLLAAQCNCAYWHGVFGGIYLPHLRRAVYKEIIKAEKEAGIIRPKLDQVDFDCDGHKEIILSDDRHTTIVWPVGAQVVELDCKEVGLNIADVFGRREEGYSDLVASLGQGANSGSIHDGFWVKEGQVLPKLVFDDHHRGLFLDHFFTQKPTAFACKNNEIEDLGDFAYGEFEFLGAKNGFALFKRDGHFAGKRVRVVKAIGDMLAIYAITNLSNEPLSGFFAPEMNIASDSGYDEYIGTFWGQQETKRDADIECPASNFVMKTQNFFFELSFTTVDSGLQYVVQTVSNSEGGIETIDQGLCLLPLYGLELAPGQSLEINIKARCANVR